MVSGGQRSEIPKCIEDNLGARLAFGSNVEFGVGRIIFAADYPYTSMAKARAVLDQIPASAADRALIAHGNAENLFRLKQSCFDLAATFEDMPIPHFI